MTPTKEEIVDLMMSSYYERKNAGGRGHPISCDLLAVGEKAIYECLTSLPHEKWDAMLMDEKYVDDMMEFLFEGAYACCACRFLEQTGMTIGNRPTQHQAAYATMLVFNELNEEFAMESLCDAVGAGAYQEGDWGYMCVDETWLSDWMNNMVGGMLYHEKALIKGAISMMYAISDKDMPEDLKRSAEYLAIEIERFMKDMEGEKQ